MKSENRRFWETVKLCGVVLVTAVAVSLAIPIAVGATGSFVTIQDDAANNSANAQVDGGRLRVGDGLGPLTVDGSVAVRPYTEWRRYFATVFNSGGGPQTCVVLAAVPPAGKAIVLTTLDFNIYSNPSPSDLDFFGVYANQNCDAADQVSYLHPPGTGLTPVDYSPGVISKQGFSIKVSSDPQAHVNGTGYLIPSAGLP